jgi:NAD(P)-dependent dehydrogenase (short-subunit alcohol dehydrogenase family)
MIMDLHKKVIVVTGGSGLIGKAIVRDIRTCGGTAINADISVSKDLSKDEYAFDIADETSILELRDAVVERHGRIDGWVNSVYPRTKDLGAPFEEMSAESWRKNVDLHLNGYTFCMRAALGQMKKQRDGSIVNIASIYGVVAPDYAIYEGLEGMTSAPVYGAIKGGILQLTRYLASLYGPYGIRVNAVSPGGIFDGQPPVFVERYKAKTMLRRMGTAEDVAGPVAFLLSDAARYITGHNVMVDGGLSAM